MKSLILGFLFALLMAVSCGCGVQYFTYHQGTTVNHISHAVIIPIYIDSDFSVDHRKAIIAAADEWNTIFNGQVKLVIEEDKFSGLEEGKKIFKEKIAITGEGWVVVAVNHDNALVEDMENVLAFVSGPGGHTMVVIKDVIGKRDLKTIVMHEMGHLMGAEHVRLASLMVPYYSNYQYECIDKITVAQIAMYMKLDFDTLNYCITPRFE